MLKKRILALTMAVALVGTAGLAFAGTDLSDPKSDPVSFAIETLPAAVAGKTTMLWPAGVPIVGEVGFGGDVTSDRYFRFDMTNASFEAQPGLSIPGGTCNLSQGGLAGNSFAIFNCRGSYLQDDAFALDFINLNTADRMSSVTMQYVQYNTPQDAASQVNPIAGTKLAGTIVTLESGLSITSGDVTPLLIDINADEKKFVDNNATSVVGEITADLGSGTATLYSATTGLALAFSDVILTGPLNTAAAAFATASSVFTSADDTCAVAIDVLTQNATDKTKFSLPTYGAGLAASGATSETVYLCYTADTTKKIVPGPVTGSVTKLTPTPEKIYDLGTLSVLELNASTDRLTFALTPSGVYPYYVRVTNPDVKTGSVFFTVINDAGVSSTFDIATLPTANLGLTAGKLAAGASTNLIPITDIFAAAQAANASFDVAGGSMKLRIEARAQFGTLPGSSDDVVLNAFTVANDGSTFSMISADAN
jgi:hypothetical protein